MIFYDDGLVRVHAFGCLVHVHALIAKKLDTVLFSTGGHELIYRFLGHVLGVPTKFSGVSMHMGHFNGHMREFSFAEKQNDGFAPDDWRKFLQSGVALWLRNLSVSTALPCCDLKFVGGDGTSIGIPLSNVAGLRPVWEPPSGVVDEMPAIPERMIPILMTHPDYDGNYIKRLRNNLRLALSSTVNSDSFSMCAETYFSTTKDCLPKWFHDCFVEFTELEGAFRDSLRRLLRNCISEVSVTTLVPLALLNPLSLSCDAMEQVRSTATARAEMASLQSLFPFGHEGVLPEIVECVRFSCDRSLQSLKIIVSLIRGLGELSNVGTVYCLLTSIAQ